MPGIWNVESLYAAQENILQEPCPVGQFNDGQCYIRSLGHNSDEVEIREVVPLSTIVDYFRTRFMGVIPDHRLGVWFSTIPQNYLSMSVQLLDNFEFVGLPAMRERMLGRMLDSLSVDNNQGDVLFFSPVAYKEMHHMYDNSACIIGRWFQDHLIKQGWKADSTIEKSPDAGIPDDRQSKSQTAILNKDGRRIVIMNSNDYFEGDLERKFGEIVLYDDWSLTGAHFSFGLKSLVRMVERGLIDTTTPLSLAYGFMTEDSYRKVMIWLKRTFSDVTVIGKDKSFFVPQIGYIDWHPRNRAALREIKQLTPACSRGSGLSEILIATAISTPDNIVPLLSDGVSTKEFSLAYPHKVAPLVTDPRTGDIRRVYIS
jgi:hypothetical protein